ncbi:endoglucanase [Streptomyces sp. NPDC006798]|uniref:endoglucanase n=1 Tax=Streptomyces sp. NPDC006798 TaxID=3155462 RepID=UPI00340D33B5
MPTRTRSAGRLVAFAAPFLFAAAALTAAAPGTAAAATPGEATGPTGQKLTVSETANIDPAGQKVRVSGTGYDVTKGIYLAVCRVPEPGEQPSPCLGGSDFSGSSGSSYWISNNPPPYGVGLVKKFTADGDGKGSFTFDLTLKAKDSGADCTQARCAVVTRADHTHISDRDQDVIVPFTFAAGGGPPAPEVPAGTVRHQALRTLTPPVGGADHAVADPAKGRLYVASDSGTERRLTTYDTTTGQAVGAPAVLPGAVSAMALDSGANALHLAFDGRLATYDTKSGELTDKALLDAHVSLLAVDPSAGRVYAAEPSRRSVTTFTTGRTASADWQRIGAPAVLRFPPAGLAVDTSADRAYATHVGPNTSTSPMTFHNILNGIDGKTGAVTSELSLGTSALGSMGLTVDPKTRTGYVANLAAGTAFAVDLAANKVTGTLPAGPNPKAMAFDASTETLYVARTQAPEVAAIDVRTGKTEVLEVGDQPSGITLDPEVRGVFTVADGKVTHSQRQVSPAVTRAPKAATVTAGGKAEFTAAATGFPAPVNGWEVSSDGSAWLPIAGASGPKLTFTAAREHDGNRYRAVFSNPVGSLRSAPAALTVKEATQEPPPGSAGGSSNGSANGGSSGGSSSGSTGGHSTGGGNSGTTGASGGGSAGGGSTGGGASGGGTGGSGGGSLASTGTSAFALTGAAAGLAVAGALATFLVHRRRGTA